MPTHAVKDDHARNSALATLSAIKEMVDNLTAAEKADDDKAREEAERTIHEDPLSVLVRSGWHAPGETPSDGAEEYELLLATGGPAVRIRGTLGKWSEPETAVMQYQDWFTPWKDLGASPEDADTLLRYARCFYFG